MERADAIRSFSLLPLTKRSSEVRDMRAHRQALVAVLATLAAVSVAAGQQTIRWQTNLDAARQWAAQSHRPLLLHFWSETCEPCARMERDVFSRPEIAAVLENYYVPVKINVRQFPMTAQQFGVTSWPSDLVVTPQGQVIDRWVGYQPPAAYLGRLNQVAAIAQNQAAARQKHPHYGGGYPGREPMSPGQAGTPMPQPSPFVSSGSRNLPGASGTFATGAAPASTSATQESPNPHPRSPANFAAMTSAPPLAWERQGTPGNREGEGTRPYETPQPRGGAIGPDSANAFANTPSSPGFQRAALRPNQPDRTNGPLFTGMTGHTSENSRWPSAAEADTQSTNAVNLSGPTVPGPNAPGVNLPGARGPGANLHGAKELYQGQMSNTGTVPSSSAYASAYMGENNRMAGQPASETASDRGQSAPVPGAASTTPPRGNPPLALDGYCAVSLAEKERWVRGNPRFGVIHQGQTYLFAGPEEARRFYNDPDRYAPVASGDDVVLLAERGQRVPGRREHGAWYEGRVYLFADETSYNKFAADPARYATAWPSEAGQTPGFRTETTGGSPAPGRGAETNPSPNSASLPPSEIFSSPASGARLGDPNAQRPQTGWR